MEASRGVDGGLSLQGSGRGGYCQGMGAGVGGKEAGHGPSGFGTVAKGRRIETMRPGRKEPRGFTPTASGCVAGVFAALTLGACGLETIAGPEEVTEAPRAAMDGNAATESPQGSEVPGEETAEAQAAAADARHARASRAPMIRWSSEIPAEDRPRPLVLVDGVRWGNCWNEIAGLNIESFEIIRRSDAVDIYGEDARDGAILIFTKQSNGDSKGGEMPCEPLSR